MWWPEKCAFVRCSDDAESPDTKLAPGHETHALLHIALKDRVSESAHERCFEYGYIDFIDTITKTLRILRLLSFT